MAAMSSSVHVLDSIPTNSFLSSSVESYIRMHTNVHTVHKADIH